jgi:hypothetical protein
VNRSQQERNLSSFSFILIGFWVLYTLLIDMIIRYVRLTFYCVDVSKMNKQESKIKNIDLQSFCLSSRFYFRRFIYMTLNYLKVISIEVKTNNQYVFSIVVQFWIKYPIDVNAFTLIFFVFFNIKAYDICISYLSSKTKIRLFDRCV